MTGSTRRRRRFTVASAATLGIASIAAAGALGHIPGVGNGLPPTTNGPDLRTVEVFGTDLNDVLPEQARFCFDQNLASVIAGPAGGFFALQTYDARRAMNPTSASRDTGNEKCAVASFAAGTDITQATVGEVVPGAVTDLQSRTNTLASEPVTGSVHTKAPGSTTGPDLQNVVVNTGDASHKLAQFIFDENLNPTPGAAYQATDFGFYNSTDTPVAAPAGAVSISGKTATVDFLATPQVEGAKRFFINTAAVQDRPQTATIGGLPLVTPSSPDVFSNGAVGSGRPEVTSATPIGAQDFKVVFNSPVQFTPASAAFFIAVSDDGSFPAAATAIGSGGTGDSVIVTFPASVANDPGGIVRIFLAGGGVTSVGGALPNLAGQAPTSTPNSVPGFTNGPDLLSVGVDTGTSRVTYRYDETVQDGPAAAAFQGAAADGAAINSIGGVVVSGASVTALFPPSVGSAVVFANPFNSITDKTTRPNPHQSTSNVVQTAPPPPPPPPGAAPPPPPAPPPGAGTIPRYKTTVTIKRRGRVYSGTVRSARKACRQGRRVILKRRGNVSRFGTSFSKKTGSYTIKRKKRLRGRVYVYVTPRSTSVNCLPGKSKTIRG